MALARFKTPDEVDGLPRFTNAKYTAETRRRTEVLKRYVSAPSSTLAELYLSEGISDSIEVSAVSGVVADREKWSKKLFSTSPTKDLSDVEPGALGGVAQCGTLPGTTVYLVTACAWVDKRQRGHPGLLVG